MPRFPVTALRPSFSEIYGLQLKVKYRAIDDLSRSGANMATGVSEHLQLPTVEQIANLARFIEGIDKIGKVAGAAVDLKAAYLQLPIMPSHRKYALTAYHSHKNSEPRLIILKALSFGAVSSVYHFNMLPALVCAIMQSLFRCNCFAYFDDFILIESLETI